MERWLYYLLNPTEMNWYRDFERCLDKRWLVRMPEAHCLVTNEIDVARDDLARRGYHAEADNP
jgi:hypothetical protein